MTTEFIVALENRPGTLADLSEVLGNAGVSIIGGAGLGHGDIGLMKMVVDKPDAAREALDNAGVKYEAREVLNLIMPRRAGSLALYARAVANAGINIDSIYVTMEPSVVVGVDKLEAARNIARDMNFL